MKGLGASAVAAAGLSYEHGPVGNTQAIAPLVAGALAAGALGLGWSLRDSEIIGADAPAEGLTASVLRNEFFETSRTRDSTNGSTIVDNANILDGVEHTAYTEAKIAAIEKLNQGAAESEVLNAATAEIDAYETTVRQNLLKSWNESISELMTNHQAVLDHPDLSAGAVVSINRGDVIGAAFDQPEVVSETYSLPDGTSIDIQTLMVYMDDSFTTGRSKSDWGRVTMDPRGYSTRQSADGYVPEKAVSYGVDVTKQDSLSSLPEDQRYMEASDWEPIWSEMNTLFTNVRDGISTWVTTVYGDVQSGEIEVSDLVTPRERASMMAEEEGTSQAIADLIALNQPVDLEREATITVDSTGATMRGTFGLSDASDGPLEVGVTYDPSTFTGDVYFTTDMSLVEGDWTAINTAVDGGNITITSEPYEGTAIEVTTTADETVSVPAADWTDNGDGTWTYDASGDLETAITEVASARFHATGTETQYETLKLDGSFTVDEMTNTQTGEPATSTTFTSSEPQTDSNYITQEEWDQLEQQNQELIEQFENSQSNGGGLDLSGLDMFGVPGEIVAVVVAGAAALFASSN